METHRQPYTANCHFIKSCTFSCRYCFATFADVLGRPVLPDDEVLEVTRVLARHFTKVTFAGGEPTLYPLLPTMLAAAEAEGALTNLVTNGSTIDAKWLAKHADVIGFLTLSVDSGDAKRLRALGRAFKYGTTLTREHYVGLAEAARALGIGVKVNTVVTTVNMMEDLSDLVASVAPTRWKILQAAPVEGQNDEYIDRLTPTRADFDCYVDRHVATLDGSGIRIVAEPVDAIRGSYVMVDPQGRLFDSTSGRHRYSAPILDVGLESAFREIAFDTTKFESRGGNADWRDGGVTTRRAASATPVLVGLGAGA